MVAELRERYGTGVIVDLVRGGRGVFDVDVDTVRVFSKDALHRFPEPGEVLRLVASRPGAQ